MAKRKKQRDYEHIGFTLSAENKRELEARADEKEISTSHLLRQLVRVYLKNGAPSAVSTPDPGGAVGATTRRLN